VFKRGRRQPFFSVVIASYNSAAWIKHTIRSVLEQTYRNFEIVVMGDGCTDGTEELLKTEFGKRIRWKNLPSNSGSQSAPNNEGIRLAHGSHIAYLGHDDIWSRYHLELLDGVVREQDPGFVVSGAVYHGPPDSRINLDDRAADFVCERSGDGTYIFSGQLSTGVNDGLALRFRMPRSVPIETEFGTRRAGLALNRVEITPDRD
jgi:glycosyltransferase involved in cell wall biosynthesis